MRSCLHHLVACVAWGVKQRVCGNPRLDPRVSTAHEVKGFESVLGSHSLQRWSGAAESPWTKRRRGRCSVSQVLRSSLLTSTTPWWSLQLHT